MHSMHLSKNLGHALDITRGAAATYVVIHHVALAYDFQGPFALFKSFGHQAVILFFLLSGFVIYANEHHRVLNDLSGYAKRRLFRIYPPLIAAMIVSTCVVWFNGDLSDRFSLSSLLGTLANLQDTKVSTPGTVVSPYLGNSPLWSLAYEMWFYALYPLATLVCRWQGKLGEVFIGVICVLSYLAYEITPNHFLIMTGYFAVWWLGAMIAKAYGNGHRTITSVPIPTAFLVATIIVAALPTLGEIAPRHQYPLLQLNHLISGLIFAVVLFGPVGAFLVHRISLIPASVTLLSSISYGMYILHWPILIQWRISYESWGMLLAIPVFLALSYLADRGSVLLVAKLKRARRLPQSVPSSASYASTEQSPPPFR